MSRRQSPPHVCGTGSRGVIVSSMPAHKGSQGVKLIINTHVPRNTKVVYKVTTDSCIHFKDMTQASYLTLIDPNQKHFLYPVATYTMKGDNKHFLQQLDQQNRVPHKQFNVNAQKVYVDIIPHGGKSLHALYDDEATVTSQEAIAIIKNLVEGIATLHRNNIIHGDVHDHNVVIDLSVSHGRWIDFSEMKGIQPEDGLVMQREVKRLISIVRTIANMVSDSHEALEEMSSEIAKGSAPMSAMELQSNILHFLSKKRSRSRSDSSFGVRPSVAKKLML